MPQSSINASRELYERLRRECEQDRSPVAGNPLLAELPNLFGIPVRVSNAFPHEYGCGVCGGSGEGSDSTYCGHCRGAGRVRILGAVTGSGIDLNPALNAPLTLIRDTLPRLFQPSFPDGLVPPPKLCGGLP